MNNSEKCSQTISRKFVSQIEVDDWLIETEAGWEEISHSNKTIEYDVYRVELSNGMFLECADNHIIIRSDDSEVFAKDSIDHQIQTSNGPAYVTSVENLGYSECMYDLSVNSENHTYYTNGILSHNTQCSAAYILWSTIFQERYTVAILANKSSSAREILSRYQDMFQSLPMWLQQGVSDWNKGNITLENGSKVFTAATSKDAIRGKSCNFVYVDETAIIPNNIAEEFFTAAYPTISSGDTTKLLLTSTPLGFNLFWKYFTDAENGINDFIPISVHYSEIPGRDEEWAQRQLKLLGELKFGQEVLCVGGETLIKIRNKHNGVIEEMKIEYLYNLL
jgi:hypothetical protein